MPRPQTYKSAFSALEDLALDDTLTLGDRIDYLQDLAGEIETFVADLERQEEAEEEDD